MKQENWALARNVVLYSELEKILARFNKAIIIGGAGLAKTAYNDISLRPMSDIDLLVEEKDLSILRSVLEKLGYKFENERSTEIHYCNNNSDITFHIDIHTDLIYVPKAKLNDIRARAIKADFGSSQGLVLSPQDAFIYAIADAFIGHGMVTQNTINDISAILTKYRIDWYFLQALVKQYGLEAPLYYGIISIKKQSSINVPDWFMHKIKPPQRKFLESKIYEKALKNPAEDLAPVLRLATCSNRFSYASRSFFPAGKFMSRRYGVSSAVLWILYPYRVMNHCWRMIKLVVSVMG